MMSGKLLLFGFDTLPSVLAVESAAGPLGAEVVPIGRSDYNKTLAALAGLLYLLLRPYPESETLRGGQRSAVRA